MIYKRIITASLAFLTLLFIIPLSGCGDGKLSVKDKDGNVAAELTQKDMDENTAYKPYLEVVLKEAKEAVAEINNCNSYEAENFLYKNNCVIETCFDPDIYDAIEKSYSDSELNGSPFGCAITDLKGGLYAVFSSASNDDANYALSMLSPYSSLKPLSVYAPAIESGAAGWSKVYEDSPYKQIKDDSGELVDWPENATGVYTNSNTTVYQAVKESLNTVAVKCLADYGVNNSISFLKENLNINLDYESQKAESENEDEVIGNLAMGYLYDGVSVKDMAGYYQIFANGGKYYEPEAITEITDESGKTIYTKSGEYKQVISESTAYIMNNLLQGVVQSDGTGAKAKMNDVPVGGKTGTGTANDCHWFVGFVPEYSCAVWHGGSFETNYSPEIFSSIMSKIDLDKNAEFSDCYDVKQAVYCCESGLLCTENCQRIDTGYYFAGDEIGICKIHQ